MAFRHVVEYDEPNKRLVAYRIVNDQQILLAEFLLDEFEGKDVDARLGELSTALGEVLILDTKEIVDYIERLGGL